MVNGFYLIKNAFFEKMNDSNLKYNKDENRPFFYCIKDKDNLIWMIPLSSRIEKYSAIIQKRLAQKKSTEGIYITKLPNDKQSAFLIQDIFPILEEYIERSYTFANAPMFLINEKDIKTIENRAKKIISIVKNKGQFSPSSPNIHAILEKLR